MLIVRGARRLLHKPALLGDSLGNCQCTIDCGRNDMVVVVDKVLDMDGGLNFVVDVVGQRQSNRQKMWIWHLAKKETVLVLHPHELAQWIFNAIEFR